MGAIDPKALEAFRFIMAENLGSDEFTACVWDAAQNGLKAYLSALAPADVAGLVKRAQRCLDDAQATGPNPTNQGALEFMLKKLIAALSSTPTYDDGVRDAAVQDET